jgi:hypothetical protein
MPAGGTSKPTSPENARLGVNIVQVADISWDLVCDSNQRRCRTVSPAMNGSLLNLGGLSPVTAKLLWRDSTGGGTSNGVRGKSGLFICSIRVTPWYFRARGHVASLCLDQGQRDSFGE